MHYEEAVTYVATGEVSCAQACASFLSCYAASPQACDAASGGPCPPAVELRRAASGVALPGDALLVDCCRDGEDLVAVRIAPLQLRPAVTAPLVGAPPPAAPPAAPPAPAAALPDTGAPLDEVAQRALLARAVALADEKQYALSTAAYERLLGCCGERNAALAPDCFLGLADNALAVERGDLALQRLRRGVDCLPKSARLLYRLGALLAQQSKHDDAHRCLQLALQALRAGSSSARGGSRAALAAQAALSRSLEHDIQAEVAGALYARGERDAGASLVMRVLKESNEQHTGALMAYAHVALEQGRAGDSVSVLLRLLAAQPKRTDIKAKLAGAVSAPGGVNTLMAQLHATGEGLATALAFLATAVKEAGAVAAAAEIHGRAAALMPGCAGHTLAHAHVLEACADGPAALTVVSTLLAQVPATRLGGGATFASMLPLLQGLPAVSHKKSCAGLGWYRSDARNASLPSEEALLASLQAGSAATTPGGPALGAVKYAVGEAEALACLCTAAKLLFAGGAIARTQELMASLAPSVHASSVALHTTPIRNEHAFFLHVHALLQRAPIPAPPPQAREPIFLVGDSHVLSAAWRSVTLRGHPRTLVPQLITGLKAYHLRSSSQFYPKKQWELTVERLPPKSTVISLLGEIDCREGLLVAVERDAAADVAAAAAQVAAMYLEAVAKLTQPPKSCEVLVHPVPPVLPLTRHLVGIFNAALKEAVAKAGNAKIRWLEFGTALCSEQGLRSQFMLDGTHLAPRYVDDVLNAALAEL